MSFFPTHLNTPLAKAIERLGSPEALHGFLTARLLTLSGASVADWLERGFGVAGLEGLSPEAQDALHEALEAIAAALRAGNFGFPPSAGATRTTSWCEGFVEGVGMADSLWREWTDACVDVGKAMFPIHAVCNAEFRDMFFAPDRAQDPELIDELAALVAPAVRKIAIFRLADDEVLSQLLEDDDPFYELFGGEQLAALSGNELLEQLQGLHDEVPRVLIDECIRRGEALIPRLLALLEDEANWSPDGADVGVWWSLLHAMHILGALSGDAAGAALAAGLAQLRNHGEDEIWEWLHPHHAQLCAGKEIQVRPVLHSVLEDESVSPIGRSLALEWLVSTYGSGEQGLEEVLDYAAALMRDPAQDRELHELVGFALLDHPRERHRPALLEQARINEAGDRRFGYAFGVADVEDAFDGPRRPVRDPGHFLSFYDPVAIRQRRLRWFHEDEGAGLFDDEAWTPVQTYVRETPKVGRNDPCPCGSGRKYKKCCMNKG